MQKKALSFLLFVIALCSIVLLVSCLKGNDNNADLSAVPDGGSSEEDSDSTANPSLDSFDFSACSYIAFGDSITFGADPHNGYARMEDPYPELVANELGLSSYNNRGFSGATLASNNLGLGCISNIITSISESAEIVSLMGGVNDYNRNIPLGSITDTDNSTVYGALNVIAEKFKKSFPDSFVFFMTPYKEIIGGKNYLTNNSQGYNLSDVANAVREVAQKYNIPVLDMYNYGNFELEMYNATSDGIHPSQEFVKQYTAPQIAIFIKENYK